MKFNGNGGYQVIDFENVALSTLNSTTNTGLRKVLENAVSNNKMILLTNFKVSTTVYGSVPATVRLASTDIYVEVLSIADYTALTATFEQLKVSSAGAITHKQIAVKSAS